MSEKISVPSNGWLGLSLDVSCLCDRWRIELYPFPENSLEEPSLGDARAALQFSHRNYHGAISLYKTKYGIDSVSSLSLVSRLVCSV